MTFKNLIDAVRRLSMWVRQEGWRYSPWQLCEKQAVRSFDRLHGTNTGMQVELSLLDIDSANKQHGQRYQASPVYSLRQLLRRLDIDVADFTFIDFGSGKGRTLLLAGELPFKAVIGVEFSAELHDCASSNIAIYRQRQARSVASVHCDATLFDLPPGNLVLYFFNPFNDAVLGMVLANIASSLQRSPRQIIIVYLFLANPALLDNLDGFGLRQSWHRYRVYASTLAQSPGVVPGNALPRF